MSIDIYLVSPDDQPRFDRQIVERAFEGLVSDRYEGSWDLQSLEGESFMGTLSMDEDLEVKGFSVNRPPNYLPFWNALFEVMRQTPTLLVLPFVDLCCAAEHVATLPDDIIQDLSPLIVSSGAEIRAAIDARMVKY